VREGDRGGDRDGSTGAGGDRSNTEMGGTARAEMGRVSVFWSIGGRKVRSGLWCRWAVGMFVFEDCESIAFVVAWVVVRPCVGF
jgi:hypothetical protein